MVRSVEESGLTPPIGQYIINALKSFCNVIKGTE